MSEPSRHLHAVNPETGELSEEAPQTLGEALGEIGRLEDQLAGAENNVRSMRAQMANLKRELAGEIDKDHALFPIVVALFRYWQERCDHPRCELTPARMKAALPRVKEEGPERCRAAIRGAAFDPFVTYQKNGRQRVHNDWFQIMAADKFESFVNRAPEVEPTSAQRSLVDTAGEIAKRVEERTKLIDGEDPVACAHLLLEVDRLILQWRNAPTEREDDGRHSQTPGGGEPDGSSPGEADPGERPRGEGGDEDRGGDGDDQGDRRRDPEG